jgi:hypothetical protein
MRTIGVRKYSVTKFGNENGRIGPQTETRRPNYRHRRYDRLFLSADRSLKMDPGWDDEAKNSLPDSGGNEASNVVSNVGPGS